MQTVFCLAAGVLFLGCAGAKVVAGSSAGGNSGNGGGGGATGPSINTVTLTSTATSVTPPDQGAAPEVCDNPTACTDFSSSPIMDTGAPANAASQFSGTPSGAGPCVVEPEDGSLYPYNWTRPRIRWTGTSGLTQITVHADLEANDLVVYTTASCGSFLRTCGPVCRSTYTRRISRLLFAPPAAVRPR